MAWMWRTTSLMFLWACCQCLHSLDTEPTVSGRMLLSKTRVNELNPTQKMQVEQYRKGEALILNLHITHHAGTTICSWAGANGPTPKFACMQPRPPQTAAHVPVLSEWHHGTLMNDTMLSNIRVDFHFVSIELASGKLHYPLAPFPFEHPNVVSMCVMRDPISRLLSGDGRVTKFMLQAYPKFKTIHDHETWKSKMWWTYADSYFTNNYAMNSLLSTAPEDKQHRNTHEGLERCKALLVRFTFLLDSACLDDGVKKVSKELGFKDNGRGSMMVHKAHASSLSRLDHGNKTLLAFLVNKNKLDLELYHFAQQRSHRARTRVLSRVKGAPHS